ncbi:MAG: hypothetical protein ACK4XK_02435, partial [Casimicrobiaceae bacterium]
MAHINRIEIVNYLCEGWVPSMGVANWRPLWPANVINLCGASTAVQIPNGGGKTSLTNAVLYLLSQDRVLKRRFLDRCSPAGMVPTHIRIEFAILHGQDLTQRDLMTPDPQSSPAETFVIGVCANRDDDSPRFYRYSGVLEDVPACRTLGTSIEFMTAAAIQANLKQVRGHWNQWSTTAEWGKVVEAFMSPDVVRQNVMFHRDGAGDASAAFSKVTAGPGERFDEAYFRQVVAPQLLTNVMGDSAEEDERNVEDTILKSMGSFIEAKLQVETKEAYLNGRQALEGEFRPVMDAADKIEVARVAYQTQLQTLAVDAAFLTRFADARDTRMPGVPRDLAEFSLDAKVRDCLKAMVLDKDGSILIESAGLAALLGIPTGRLNESAGRTSASQAAIPHQATSAQVIDLYCDSKIPESHGGRRNSLRHYSQQAARDLASRRAGDVAEHHRILDQAFDFARTTVDTNVFRHNLRRLSRAKTALKGEIADVERAGRVAEVDQENLEKQVKEWKENQGAFQEFCAQLQLIPADLHETPAQVENWLETEIQTRVDAVSDHKLRVGILTGGWDELKQVRNELGLIGIDERLAEVTDEREQLESTKASRTTAARLAQKERDDAASSGTTLRLELEKAIARIGGLSEHMQGYEAFISLFGQVDPVKVGPPVKENTDIGKAKLRLESQRRTAVQAQEKLQLLANSTKSFRQLFGEVDPRVATPQKDHRALLESQAGAQAVYQQHQPLAESLESHLERTGRSPTDWLRATDAAHAAALEKARVAREAVRNLDLELAALDNLDEVGNADYAAAHDALTDAGLDLTRAQHVILGLQLSKDETLPLLAALAPLLDAPVAVDIDRAEAALAVLQQGGHDVPVLLLDPLVALLKQGPDHDSSTTSSLGVFAGAKSRRMRAIVDPQALVEERAAVSGRRDERQALVEEAMAQAELLTPHTDGYRQALSAQDAVVQGSAAKVNAAQAELSALEPRIAAAERLVTPEAIALLRDAKAFVEAGGTEALSTLSLEVEDLSGQLVRVDDRLAEIAPLVTQEAFVAHDGARKFVMGGGHKTFQELKEKRASVEIQVAAIDAAMPGLQAKLTRFVDELQRASERELTFMSTFQSTWDRLTRAKTFQEDGSAAFMESHAHVLTGLVTARDALNPLRSINYARAQAFKQHQGQDEAELQRQIAAAKARRAGAKFKVEALRGSEEALDGDIAEAGLASDALHELAFFLCDRRNAAAPFEEDLRNREVGSSRAESHEAYPAAEALFWQLRDWRPDQGRFDRTTISILRADVEAIDAARTGKNVGDARKHATRVRTDFERVREDFCNKARAATNGGFSEAEIEAIQNANSTEGLTALAEISGRLRDQLAAEQAELVELRQSTEVVESASIETLTRLVESCKGNLLTMNTVMARNSNARFTIEAEVISTEDIKKLMEDLRDHIESRKREAKDRQKLSRTTVDTNLGTDIRRALIDRIFMKPSVQFIHVGM